MSTGDRDKKIGVRRWVRIAFGIVGVVFLAIALVRQWEDVRGGFEFSLPRLAIATGLVAASVVALAHGWANLLLDSGDRPRMRRIFYMAQPAKYVPGGIAQPVGQVVLTTDAGIGTSRSISAFIVHALISAAAGAWLGSGVALITEAPAWLRLIAGFGILTPLLLWHPLLVRAAGLVAHWMRRPLREGLLPSRQGIVASFIWALAGILATACAFVVIGGPTLDVPAWQAVCGFSLAFTVGYLAVPFPSGIGIREGAFALILPAAGLAAIVGISALHRLIAMIAELLVLGASRGGDALRRATRSS